MLHRLLPAWDLSHAASSPRHQIAGVIVVGQLFVGRLSDPQLQLE